jgi:hypothetical protein
MSPLTTPYLHCSVCADYDLCAACDALNDMCIRNGLAPLHDPAHVLIKYRH